MRVFIAVRRDSELHFTKSGSSVVLLTAATEKGSVAYLYSGTGVVRTNQEQIGTLA